VGGGTLVANTNGSNFDTVAAVYVGDSLQSLRLVGCDDDAQDNTAVVRIPADGGVTYYIQVGRAAKGRPLTDNDSVVLRLEQLPP
jgi:hypothetical protein